MTVSYSPAQTASIITTTLDTTALSLPVNGNPALTSGALFRFALSTNLSFLYPVTFTATCSSGLVGTETFRILLMSDPDGISTLTNGVLTAAQIPEAYNTLFGDADSFVLATTSISTMGAIAFDIDMVKLAQFMSASLSYTDIWNGSLVLWLITDAISASVWSPSGATLTAYDAIDYTNRDTGTPGLESSRWTRCPISGLKIPHGKLVTDGFRSILVSPDEYDPPEPEPFDWTDRDEQNENG